MFTKKAFTLTIGNESTLLVLHDQKTVKNKILIKSLTQGERSQILEIFKENKNTPIYILLDNSEQNYIKKFYPLSLNILDLQQLVKRHIKQEFAPAKENDNEANVIYNYIAEKNKKANKWECMYVSSHYFDEMKIWIDFLTEEVPNAIIGIYMLPIETISLVKKLQLSYNINKIKAKNSTKDSSDILDKPSITQEVNSAANKAPLDKEFSTEEKITLLITQNKVSGFRQMVFFGEKIVFTRLIQYDSNSKNFIVNFEQDIFRTNEYLKRTFPNSKMEDMEIINILPNDILEKINSIKNRQIHFRNYTPKEAADQIGFQNLIADNSQYSDILIANVFINSKKILKSVNDKIKKLTLLKNILRSISIVNLFVLFLIATYAIFIKIEQSQNNQLIENLSRNKQSTEDSLQKLKEETIGIQAEVGGQTTNIDEIIEFGKLDELIEKNAIDPINLFKKLDFGLKKVMTIKSFTFNNQNNLEQNQNNFSISISGVINNESGDVENLFQIYDNVIAKAKQKFEGYKVTSSELPPNIDFSKKYYSVEFQLQITNQ